MSELRIVYWPDPILSRAASPLAHIDDQVRERAAVMLRLMEEERGVGLAAPQVGWSVRLFVMNVTGRPEDERVMVNPVIKKRSGKSRAEEGCLSIPKVWIEVDRAKRIEVEYTDLEGIARSEELEDFPARVVQHEHDHLEGVLLVHKMSPADRIQFRAALDELQAEAS